jgi:hypothetical protein
MEPGVKRRLGDIFVERRLITEGQLEQALATQRETGGRLGEVLVELGLITRVALAGVIAEQWDDLRVTASGRKSAEAEAHPSPPAASEASSAEDEWRQRLEALTAQLAARDARIAQQDATIAALLSRQSPA